MIVLLAGTLFFIGREANAPKDVVLPQIPGSQNENNATLSVPVPAPNSSGPSPSPAPKPQAQPTSVLPSKTQGRVVVVITDDVVGLNTISELRLTVSEVRVLNAAGKWVSVSSSPKQYELLMLDQKALHAVFADSNLEVGSYKEIWITLGSASVVKNGSAYPLKLPSRDIRVAAKLNIIRGKDAGVIIDIQGDTSLFQTEKGAYVFMPVVRFQTLSQTSTQIFSGIAYFTGGSADTDVTVGMNENGIVKTGFSFNKNTRFDIVGNAIRIIPPGEETKSLVITAEQALNMAIQKGYISSALSIKTTTKNDRVAWQIVGVKNNETVIVYLDVVSGETIAVE